MALGEKNKYTRLLSNTALFGISTFSSKILSFLLTRLYTSVLAVASYGIVDIVTACANLLIPLVSLGISNAVIRFGLEKGVSKQGVFTGGLTAIFSGFSLLLLLWPALGQVTVLQGQLPFLYLYVLMSCLRTLCCQFVRAKMLLRLYAIDGILSTAYTVGFNVLFLVVLKMGTTGYLLSIIAADTLSAVGLFLVARLHQYVRFKGFDKVLYKAMLKYSLPLVPAAMFWWVTNASDRFFISYMMNTEYNGLYAAANKLPSVVAIFTTIFTEAWQLSAITDGQGKDREKFFSQIFAALMGVSFVAGAGLILTCKLFMRFLVAPAFFEAWRYVPLLIISTIFSCLVTFLNSVYMVEKRSGLSLVTMMVGAGSNLILNAALIPFFGVNGAAFATMVSYMLVFVVRALNTRRFIHINFSVPKIVLNSLLLLAQAFVMIYQPSGWVAWCSLLMLGVFALNFVSLLRGAKQLLGRRGRPKA
ncbi:polysaccharide biosynthesis C-terminal domain-containing protein [Ruminococcaceae bacterium OttesenSCG-928-A16]|nr:polysaccharide biosynthesis C-terminal domain-containing protein [Ruminococcaceae bacterium OttesenSCG-928-A16]